MNSGALIQSLIYTAQRAGGAIMAVYATDFSVQSKADASPVTVADEAAEKIILADLAAIAPGVPVVAEEAVAAGKVPVIAERFFLVDPLDGTKEFISRRDEFTVNVALIDAGQPVLGVVFAPARRELFWGDVRAGKAGRIDADPDGTMPSLGNSILRSRQLTALSVSALRGSGSGVAGRYSICSPIETRRRSSFEVNPRTSTAPSSTVTVVQPSGLR